MKKNDANSLAVSCQAIVPNLDDYKCYYNIAISHQSVLNQLAYICEPDENLTEEMAIATWNSLAVSAVKF